MVQALVQEKKEDLRHWKMPHFPLSIMGNWLKSHEIISVSWSNALCKISGSSFSVLIFYSLCICPCTFEEKVPFFHAYKLWSAADIHPESVVTRVLGSYTKTGMQGLHIHFFSREHISSSHRAWRINRSFLNIIKETACHCMLADSLRFLFQWSSRLMEGHWAVKIIPL